MQGSGQNVTNEYCIILRHKITLAQHIQNIKQKRKKNLTLQRFPMTTTLSERRQCAGEN